MNKAFLNSEGIIPARIKEARASRGMSLADLSKEIGVSSQAISQYELGITKPSMTVLLKMVEILDFPFNFFLKEKNTPVTSNSAVNFRSMKSVSKKYKDALCYRVEWLDEINQYIRKYIEFPKVDLPTSEDLVSFPETDYETIEDIALNLRKHWNIGKGVITNLVELLQEKGFIIAQMKFDDLKIDAFSQWYNNLPYIVLGTDKSSAVRSRFDIAHELGHLLLHPHIDQEAMIEKKVLDQLENEANYFAGAFLLPRDSFPKEVMSTSIEHFIMLKKRWKVSIGAMVKRCQALGLFSDSQVRYLFIQISQKGYRKREPLDDVIPFEEPYLFKQAIEVLLENDVVDPDSILEEIALNKDEIDSLCCLPTELLNPKRTRPKLALLKSGN